MGVHTYAYLPIINQSPHTHTPQHEWVLTKDEILKQRDLTQTVEEMKKFNAKRKFRAAAGAVSSMCMLVAC